MAVERVVTEVTTAGSDLNTRPQITMVVADFVQYLPVFASVYAAVLAAAHILERTTRHLPTALLVSKYYARGGKKFKLSLKRQR
jgi:hypothetical protein